MNPSETVGLPGVTSMEATAAGVTVIRVWPVLPSEVAMMLAVPTAIAVTRPVALTLATVVSELDQATVRSASAWPAESTGVAVSWSVVVAASVAVSRESVTFETGTGDTTMDTLPITPSTSPEMTADPAATARTTPEELTTAICGAELW